MNRSGRTRFVAEAGTWAALFSMAVAVAGCYLDRPRAVQGSLLPFALALWWAVEYWHRTETGRGARDGWLTFQISLALGLAVFVIFHAVLFCVIQGRVRESAAANRGDAAGGDHAQRRRGDGGGLVGRPQGGTVRR